MSSKSHVASPGRANIREDHFTPWEFSQRERILIVAPHPDDEVIAAGGVIATFLKSHDPSDMRVIVVTNGDASYISAFMHGSHHFGKNNFRNLAVLRQQESLNALRILGLSIQQISFWGFPDRGLAALWQGDKKTQIPYQSSTTGYDNSKQALNSPIVPFTGENLLELFNKELCEFRPTTVILPHLKDAHLDHSASAKFTLKALWRCQTETHLQTPMLLAYRIWFGGKPWLTGIHPDAPGQLSVNNGSPLNGIRRMPLTPEIQKLKRQAIQCYRSQKQAAGQALRVAAQNTFEDFTLCDSVFNSDK